MIRDIIQALAFGMFERQVLIGITQQKSLNAGDGLIHARDTTGRPVHVNFVADKPAHLKRPSVEILNSLFDQAKRLNLDVKFIEIFAAGKRRLYAPKQEHPVFEEPLKRSL